MGAHSSKRYPIYASLVDEDGNILGSQDNPLSVSGAGGGTAQPEHVLEPHTFTNDEGEQTGTMTDHTGQPPVKATYQGGIPTEVRIEVPTGYYKAGNPDYPLFAFDANFVEDNIKQGVSIFGLNGSYTGGTFAPTQNTIQTNATAFNQNQSDYVLLFNASVPDVNENLLGLSITFMTDGDAAWEYETGKNLNVTAMSFNVMVVNGGLVANQQTIDLGSASMAVNIGNADISGGILSFDVVFTPSAGTFTINNATPMINVDIWSY